MSFLYRRLRCRELCMEKEGNNFLIHLIHHILEEIVSLELIDKKWIFLLMSGQLNGLFEFVHLAKMGLPSIIDDGQGNILFKVYNNLLSTAFIGFLQVGCDIESFLSISEGDYDTFELVIWIFVYLLDHRISYSRIGLTMCFV